MPVTRYTQKLRFNVIASQIAIALVCLSSPLLLTNPISAQPLTETQISSHIQRLKNPQQRSAAIDYLVSVGKPAVPALITALQEDSDAQVRASAAIILGKMGPAAAQAAIPLVRAIDDKDAAVRSHAVQAIEKIGKQAYVPHYMAGLDSEKEWERYSAAHALRAIGKDAAPAVPTLIKKLQDEDVWTRVNAGSVLGSIGKASVPAVPALVARLQDTDVTVRHSAAYALGAIAVSLQENLNQVSTKELNTVVADLEKALKVVQNPSLQFRPQAVTSVSDPLTTLKKEKINRGKSKIRGVRG
ncbi:HEAT repeat domain-containing protein [Brasilonema sp. UFV-L1]|uniref:HEAT repeat domain-containing protein n=1 Tax=Brasilonema sp. UFV-L1 TaxID=2234130 RepID=UPI00145E387B|nr:HEAT repeat domain-containing protein [Brasilonema sp. UFV-L1]NMG09345.1 HEAT repeat domain-containing protein [Brasilonema sp. UFV-L1]